MVRPLRVCIVALHFAPNLGGTERHAEEQARQLQALGHHVTILTTRLRKEWPSTETLGGLPVVRVGGVYRRGGRLRIGRLGIWPVSVSLLWRLWRRRRCYDVIHVCQLSPLAGVATLIGKSAKKPVIICIPSAGPNAEQRARLQRERMLMADTLPGAAWLKIDPATPIFSDDITDLPRYVWGGAALLSFVRASNAIYQIVSTRSRSLLTAHSFRPGQIVHISYGVDTEKFQPNPERRPDPAGPERVMVCVARQDYAKGVDVLLHAWGRLMQAPLEWRAGLTPILQVVGDGPLRSQTERIAAELGIVDCVEFLGSRTDIVDLLQQAWGFVLPSRWEGLPNALLEAMACGLPCIATRVSGSEDIICDGLNGLLVEPEQPAELAEALRRVIQDAELAQRLGMEGRATVVRSYQLRHVVEQCVALYRCLLAKDGGAMASAAQRIRADE